MTCHASDRISSITLPDPAWRYLILFQSWRQFLSWTSLIGATMSIVAALIWLVGDVRLMSTTITAGVLGATWSLVFATKAQFSIRGAAGSETANLERIIKECWYFEHASTGQEKRFGQKLPNWLRWSESNVTIVQRGDMTVYTGPQLVIRKLRKTLLASC
jgi:hypothetical protein